MAEETKTGVCRVLDDVGGKVLDWYMDVWKSHTWFMTGAWLEIEQPHSMRGDKLSPFILPTSLSQNGTHKHSKK